MTINCQALVRAFGVTAAVFCFSSVAGQQQAQAFGLGSVTTQVTSVTQVSTSPTNIQVKSDAATQLTTPVETPAVTAAAQAAQVITTPNTQVTGTESASVDTSKTNEVNGDASVCLNIGFGGDCGGKASASENATAAPEPMTMLGAMAAGGAVLGRKKLQRKGTA